MSEFEFNREPPEEPRARHTHKPFHLQMLAKVPKHLAEAEKATVSAVITPTIRPLAESRAGLEFAADCATALGASFVVLRSRAAAQDQFPADLAARTPQPPIVVDLPEGYTLPLPEFQNARHPIATKFRSGDLAEKRNLGLLMGLMSGWETVLFLDDDLSTRPASQLSPSVRRVPPEVALRFDDVRAEFRSNGDLMAAGYLPEDFDDNSVVCHVRKRAGRDQGGFISGSAMVIRCSEGVPYFPSAYSEDWLFLVLVMLEDRHWRPSSGVKRVGSLNQARYYPYVPDRARSEELGDVFAEGLMNLIGRRPIEIVGNARSGDYWKHVIHHRQSMTTRLLADFQADGPTDHSVTNDVQSSLRAALGTYPDSLSEAAGLMTGYFRTITADLQMWRQYTEKVTADIGSGLPLGHVLSALNVSQADAERTDVAWLPKPRRGFRS